MADGAHLPLPPTPGNLREFEAVIGLEATLRLVEIYGGTVVYVPGRDLTPEQGLGAELGLTPDACKRLAARMGNDRVRVPLTRAWLAQVYRARGASYNEIARKLRVTDSAVYKILDTGGMTAKQLSLGL